MMKAVVPVRQMKQWNMQVLMVQLLEEEGKWKVLSNSQNMRCGRIGFLFGCTKRLVVQ